MRHCPACDKELLRRPTEKRAHFVKRTYCDWECSVKGRSALAEEKRLLLDAQDHDPPELMAAMTFTSKELLHTAHQVAPQVPVSVLAEVITAVEPLIASNTRRKLMKLVATKYRIENPST